MAFNQAVRRVALDGTAEAQVLLMNDLPDTYTESPVPDREAKAKQEEKREEKRRRSEKRNKREARREARRGAKEKREEKRRRSEKSSRIL